MAIKSPALSPVRGGRKTWRVSKVSDRLTASFDTSDTSDGLRSYGNIFRKNSVSWNLYFSLVSLSTSLDEVRLRCMFPGLQPLGTAFVTRLYCPDLVI